MRRFAFILAVLVGGLTAVPGTALANHYFYTFWDTPQVDQRTTCHEARYWSKRAVREKTDVVGHLADQSYHAATSCRKAWDGSKVVVLVASDHRDRCEVFQTRGSYTAALCRRESP